MEKLFNFIAIFYILPAVLATIILILMVRDEGKFTVSDLIAALEIIFVPFINWVMVCWWVWDKIEASTKSVFSKIIPKIDKNTVLWEKK